MPYWAQAGGTPHLIVPYSYEANDNRFNESSVADGWRSLRHT